MSQSNEPAACLVAEYRDEDHFDTAIRALEKSYFDRQEVSIVRGVDDERLAELKSLYDPTSDSSPTEKTTAISTLAGGALGGIIGTVTMIGPLLVAGPLVGMAAGAVGGGLLSGVHSWGIDRDLASDYESRVRSGSKLIIIAGTQIRVDEADGILRTTDPATLEKYQARGQVD